MLEIAWPEGVIARYSTVGGATVDITSSDRPHWTCTACPGTSRGSYTGPFGGPFTHTEIHEQAQAHAEKCRAMPKPVTKDQAQAAVEEIAATVAARTPNGADRDAQIAAVRDLARLVDQTPDH